jgi:hypothetical protein
MLVSSTERYPDVPPPIRRNELMNATSITSADRLTANLAGVLPALETAYKDIHAHPEAAPCRAEMSVARSLAGSNVRVMTFAPLETRAVGSFIEGIDGRDES